MEQLPHGRRLPRQPAPVDWDPEPLLQPLVAAFGLVLEVIWLSVSSDHGIVGHHFWGNREFAMWEDWRPG